MPEDEKIYTIPLREAYKKARLKRVPYAVRHVKSYLKTHMKAKEVKIGKHLNEHLWKRSIKKPPHKVRVMAFLDGEVAKAELMGFEYEEFKAVQKKERKGLQEKLLARMGQKALKKEAEEKMIEGKSEEAKELKEKEEIKEIKEEVKAEKEETKAKEEKKEELKEISGSTPKAKEKKE